MWCTLVAAQSRGPTTITPSSRNSRCLKPASSPTICGNRSARAAGRLQLAVADYDVALQLVPDDALALTHRGVARADLGDLVLAIDDFTRALALDPSNPLAYLNRADAYAASGNLDAAVVDYAGALRLNAALASSRSPTSPVARHCTTERDPYAQASPTR